MMERHKSRVCEAMTPIGAELAKRFPLGLTVRVTLSASQKRPSVARVVGHRVEARLREGGGVFCDCMIVVELLSPDGTPRRRRRDVDVSKVSPWRV